MEFKNQFKKDIFENTAFKEVKNSIVKINLLGYSSQVNHKPKIVTKSNKLTAEQFIR